MITHKDRIAALDNKQLVALYNELTGKKIKKFSGRVDGEKRVLIALQEKAAAESPPMPAPRTVGKMGVKLGRPTASFEVLKSEGKTAIRKSSLRAKVMAIVDEAGGVPVSVAAIERKLGKEARGAVMKLLQVAHLKKVAQEEAAPE